MIKITDIFDVWYGVNLEVVNCEVVPKDIPFVSRQSVNNGVVCHIKRLDEVEPNPAHTLSIAVSGSVLSTFYHDYEYYSGRDVYIAKPRIQLSKEQMIYYAYIIEKNKYRYNYGRGANRTFRDILVPSYYELTHSYHIMPMKSPFIRQPIITPHIQLTDRNWQKFRINTFCDEPYKATAYNAIELTECEKENEKAIAYITRTDVNNGCKGYVINEDFDDVEQGNAITIGDTTATVYYQENNFICGDHMVVLRSRHFNKYVGLFITTLLSKEQFRYNYGRAFNKGIIANTVLQLPATDSGSPDWQFMEEYIKSLPYSKNI